MEQEIKSTFKNDVRGNPAGGVTKATGLTLDWQDGPLAVDGERKEPNGVFVETVIRVAIERLTYYQNTKFACDENQIAIDKLQDALRALERRTTDRVSRGVEGTHEV